MNTKRTTQMSRFSLTTNMALGTGLTLTILCAVGVSAILRIEEQENVEAWVEHTDHVIMEAMAITGHAIDMETGMRGYLLTGDESFREPYDCGSEQFETRLTKLQNTVNDNPEQVRRLGQASAVIQDWITVVVNPMMRCRAEIKETASDSPAQVKLLNEVQRSVDARKENLAEPQVKARDKVIAINSVEALGKLVAEGRGKEFFNSFRAEISEFIRIEQALKEVRKEEAVAAAAATRWFILAGCLLATITGALATVYTARSVKRPLTVIMERLQNIADGDFTQRILFSGKTEVGQLASCVNTLVERLSPVITEVVTSSRDIEGASRQIAGSSDSLAAGATEQSASLSEFSSSLEKISKNTERNASDAKDAAGVARDSRLAADKGKHEMEGMQSAISNIMQSSLEISKVIGVIDAIAFKTNLLALNAAVEAARAGEAGKGFAVVAEEVRSLAQQCADAARTTSTMIEESTSHAHSGVSMSERVAASLEGIDESTSLVNDLLSQISYTSEEQAKAITLVTRGVVELEAVNNSTAMSSVELSAVAARAASQVKQLRHISSRFRIDGGDHSPTIEGGPRGARLVA